MYMRYYGGAPGHLGDTRTAEAWQGMDVDSHDVDEVENNMDVSLNNMQDFDEDELVDYNRTTGNENAGPWDDGEDDAAPRNDDDDDDESSSSELELKTEDTGPISGDDDDDGYASV
jgi:hypothetical protein